MPSALARSAPRRAAIVGSSRIPFARSNTAYTTLGNLELLSAALTGLVDRFGLRGATLGEVAAGAVIKHSARLEPDARGRAQLRPRIRTRPPTTCSAPAAPA